MVRVGDSFTVDDPTVLPEEDLPAEEEKVPDFCRGEPVMALGCIDANVAAATRSDDLCSVCQEITGPA